MTADRVEGRKEAKTRRKVKSKKDNPRNLEEEELIAELPKGRGKTRRRVEDRGLRIREEECVGSGRSDGIRRVERQFGGWRLRFAVRLAQAAGGRR